MAGAVYRDVDTMAKGDKKADSPDLLWRDVRRSIADIRGAARLYAELCR